MGARRFDDPRSLSASRPVVLDGRVLKAVHRQLNALGIVRGERVPPWHQARSWYELRVRLFRAAGRVSFTETPALAALDEVWWALRKTTKERATARKLVRALCDNEQLRTTFDSIFRLNGARAAAKHAVALFYPPPPPLTPEERAQRALVARAKARAKREAHARAMLAKHERALAREERAVARWRRKVAAYDRRAAGRGQP